MLWVDFWSVFRILKGGCDLHNSYRRMQRKCRRFLLIFVFLPPGWPDLAKNVILHDFWVFEFLRFFHRFSSDFDDAKWQDDAKHMGMQQKPKILCVLCDISTLRLMTPAEGAREAPVCAPTAHWRWTLFLTFLGRCRCDEVTDTESNDPSPSWMIYVHKITIFHMHHIPLGAWCVCCVRVACVFVLLCLCYVFLFFYDIFRYLHDSEGGEQGRPQYVHIYVGIHEIYIFRYHGHITRMNHFSSWSVFRSLFVCLFILKRDQDSLKRKRVRSQ